MKLIQIHIKRGPVARDSFKGVITAETSTHWLVTALIESKPVLHRVVEWFPKNSLLIQGIVYAE